MMKEWYPILRLLHEEPLKSNIEIICNSSFEPRNYRNSQYKVLPLHKINIVILGYEPSSIPFQSNGLAYGINKLAKTPDYINEILEELNYKPNTKNWQELEHWFNQGVLLYNVSQTVETGLPRSHIKIWKEFSIEVVKFISQRKPCIWLIWGKRNLDYVKFIHNPFFVKNYDEETINKIPSLPYHNYVLEAEYPGTGKFKGCDHFKFANIILNKTSNKKINWYEHDSRS